MIAVTYFDLFTFPKFELIRIFLLCLEKKADEIQFSGSGL